MQPSPPATPSFLDLTIALMDELVSEQIVDPSVPPMLHAVYATYTDDTRAFINNFIWPLTCLFTAVHEFAMADRAHALGRHDVAILCELRAGMMYAEASLAIDVQRLVTMLQGQNKPSESSTVLLQFLQHMALGGKTRGGTT